MKTFLASILIAAVLLGGGFLFNSAMNRVSEELAAQNSETLKSITAGDFVLASALSEQMNDYINKKYTLLATIVDHNIIDDIELCVSELTGYTEREDGIEAQVRCLRLGKLIRHLRTNYNVTLQNIL